MSLHVWIPSRLLDYDYNVIISTQYWAINIEAEEEEEEEEEDIP
jgi:hypothetical protein